MNRFFTVSGLLFAVGTILFAQQPPVKWEEIPLSELQMTSFEKDPDASAVILCDYGESKFDDDLNIVYARHLRIKILNENGYEWGTHSISLYTGDSIERLDELEGITYHLNENGEIIQSELDSDDIFKEKVTDNRTKYKFTMPALKPGCIVDIHYRIITNSISYMRDWTFQRSEPVVWSEYRIISPMSIAYATVISGNEPWEVMDETETQQIFRGRAASILGKDLVKCRLQRYAVKNIPALRNEPYITTLNDYANKLSVQLSGYAFPGRGKTQVLQDWKTLANRLLEINSFGKSIDVTGDVKSLTAEVTKGLTSPEEKMIAIYNWIARSVVYNEVESIFSDSDVDDVIELKKGNVADVAFLLLSMLKSAGIQGDPVILSTRSNGKIQELYPIYSQFNYVIARAYAGSKTYLLDATDPYRPYDILPPDILNVRALVVKENKPEWIFISAVKENLHKTLINASIEADGSVKAEIEDLYGEYRSLSLRRSKEGKSEMDIAAEIYNPESSGFIIDSVKISAMDSLNLPLKVKISVSSDHYSQPGGEFIYFNPVMVHRMKDNPFKTQIRKFDIDYAYPRGHVIIVNIKLPDGYEIKENFNKREFTVGKSATFKRISQVDENGVQIIYRTDIKDATIKAANYKKLKDFYSGIISAQSEMIVIGPKAK
jgi:transglutaminase-like putative cysteine protease